MQFDNGGAVRSRTPLGAEWPASSSWSRGFDYDGDGRDDLIVSEPGGRLTLRRFTNDGGLRDTKVLNPQANPDNLRFPGYFTASGRASQLTHHRGNHAIIHVWFEVVGDGIVIHPAAGEAITTLVENVPEGALVVVGNFKIDR